MWHIYHRSAAKIPLKNEDFRSISLNNCLLHEAEDLIKLNPQYKDLTEFVSEAVHLRLETLTKKAETVTRM